MTLNNGADWLHHDYVRLGGTTIETTTDPREARARRDLSVLKGIVSKAEILLDMRQTMSPDGDFTVLQDRLDRAKQNAASMQVVVDAYDKDKVK